MIRDAEKYRDEDEAQQERIAAKNHLEGYAFSLKTTVNDERLQSKFSEKDKSTVLNKCNDVLKWLESNQVSFI